MDFIWPTIRFHAGPLCYKKGQKPKPIFCISFYPYGKIKRIKKMANF
jgi:hypothetical protein